MKKLTLGLLLLTMIACKKTTIAPTSCYLLQWEKVTTYAVGTDLRYDFPQGKEERGADLQCDLTTEGLADLLKRLNSTLKTDSICITVHTVAIPQKNK